MSEYQKLLEKREKLEVEITLARAAERDAAVKEIERLLIEFQITRDELREIEKKIIQPREAPRYWNPETGATWSGRGRSPKWLDRHNLDAYRLPDQNGES